MSTTVRLTSDVLVGRDEELRLSLAALRNLSEGRPGVVMVSGPAGIGKTRFVTALAEQLRRDGVRVMVGGCLDLGAGAAPYSALVAAFRSVDPPAVQLLDALTGAVTMRRARLFELLRTTMTALARRVPTVLVIEDVHWLDRITRDALLYLTGMAREGRWGLVLTFRDDEVAARHVASEFLEALHREASVRASLDPLPLDAVTAQVGAINGAPPSPDTAERVYRRSGGIPLLVEEVLAAETAGAAGVPDHLRDLFLARVDRLGVDTARAVEVVAVVGDRCGERLAADVLGADRFAVAAALDRAVAADVLSADRKGYRMRHDLLREAVYGSIAPGRRRELHARIAATLAASSAEASALAYHWYEADEPAQAALANLDAADLAERVHAPGERLAYLERALEHFDALPPDRAAAVGGRAGLLTQAAEAAYLSGGFARAVELAGEALALGGAPEEIAVRWERLARYRWVSRDGVGADEAYERSVATLPDDASALARARVLSGYAWYLSIAGRPDDARSWSDRALRAAERCDEPLERCRALLAWGQARLGDERGLDALRESRDAAIACDAGDELARAQTALDRSHRLLGNAVEREQALMDGLRHVAAHGVGKTYAPVLTYLLAELLIDLGRWDEAEQLLDDPAAGEAAGMPAIFGYAYRARLAAGRGRPRAAAEAAERAETLSANLPQQSLWRSLASCARAESCLWSRDADRAAGFAEQASSISDDPLCASEAVMLQARAGADQAERARLLGKAVASAAPVIRRRAVDLTDSIHPRIHAYGATTVAELSRWDGRRDPAPWREAVAAWEAALDPYRATYCRWRLAHALLATRSGRREAAHELRAAHDAAERLRAQPLAQAIAKEAATARIPLDGSTGEIPMATAMELGLTHRELEILPLLAAGRTNAEIATTLVISPRTVGVHVSRILQKLGAARRTEAADIARRRGLLK